MALDPFKYIDTLSQERYRAIIIHVDPRQSQQLTRFVKNVCQESDRKYLDLLDRFIQSDKLKKKIDSFSTEDLRTLMIEESEGFALIVIDRIDFLLDTWRKREREAFFRMLTDQWDGYRDGMKAMIIVCLQTSHEIENLNICDSFGNDRIFHLSDFNDIL